MTGRSECFFWLCTRLSFIQYEEVHIAWVIMCNLLYLARIINRSIIYQRQCMSVCPSNWLTLYTYKKVILEFVPAELFCVCYSCWCNYSRTTRNKTKTSKSPRSKISLFNVYSYIREFSHYKVERSLSQRQEIQSNSH